MSDVKGVRWTHVRKPEGGVTICLGYMRLQRRVPPKLHLSSRHDELFRAGCPSTDSDDGVKDEIAILVSQLAMPRSSSGPMAILHLLGTMD
jgi:hypothetical protein